MKRSRYEVRVGLWLQDAGFPPHELEHPFAKAQGRRWRIDYAWPDCRVGVEVDGGGRLVRWQTNPRTGRSQPVAVGRHGSATDYEKLNYAAEHGWRILRFNPDLLTQPDYVLYAIARTLLAAGAALGSTAQAYADRPPPPPRSLRSKPRPAHLPAPGGSAQPPGLDAGSPGPKSR
jgi:hypothetical protein